MLPKTWLFYWKTQQHCIFWYHLAFSVTFSFVTYQHFDHDLSHCSVFNWVFLMSLIFNPSFSPENLNICYWAGINHHTLPFNFQSFPVFWFHYKRRQTVQNNSKTLRFPVLFTVFVTELNCTNKAPSLNITKDKKYISIHISLPDVSYYYCVLCCRVIIPGRRACMTVAIFGARALS